MKVHRRTLGGVVYYAMASALNGTPWPDTTIPDDDGWRFGACHPFRYLFSPFVVLT